ncbi:hypothetical protein BDD12DRAFT_982194 [Trichophaea hybrida]|nr:hypothetical protein BDD12DRAFT_982194 [Trichophaea hybrida]
MSIPGVEKRGGRWTAYVVADSLYFGDHETYHHILQRLSDKLFSTNEINLESLLVRSSGEVHSVSITDEEGAKSLFDTIQDDTTHVFFYTQQPTSWGRFLVTCEIFARILGFCNVFAPFLDYVQAFGLKTREEDENFCGYHRRIYNGMENRSGISYEQHGRGGTGTSAWSIRQLAVYVQYDTQTRRSRWLLLQPGEKIKCAISRFLKDPTIEKCFSEDPMILHSLFFNVTEKNWRAYINVLEEALAELEDRALYARVGDQTPRRHDFPVSFMNSQMIQRLCRKLIKVSGIIESSLEVATGYELHCKDLARLGVGGGDPSLLVEVEIYAARMRDHRGSIAALLQRAQGGLKLYWQILDYRNDENIYKITEAMRQNSDTMRVLAASAREDNEAIGRLAEKSQKDSRAVKVLTYVALMYLPAQLVAIWGKCAQN